MNRTELRKQVLSLPMNSILYIDVPKEDGAKLCLERIKLSALDCLLRSNFRKRAGGKQQCKRNHRRIYQNLFKLCCRHLLPSGRDFGGRYDNPAFRSVLSVGV